MTAAWLRPLGLLALMIGFGLRLETDWQRLGAACVVAGALAGAVGLLVRRADAPTRQEPRPPEAFAAGDEGR